MEYWNKNICDFIYIASANGFRNLERRIQLMVSIEISNYLRHKDKLPKLTTKIFYVILCYISYLILIRTT